MWAVIVPIALPGKQPGWCATDQRVEHVAGLWPVRSDTEYRAARDGASMAATSHLGTRPGLPSYAVIRRDGHSAVFEDIDWRTTRAAAPATLAHP